MKKELYHLTSAQNSIWLTEQLSENSSINNVGGYVLIHDNVNFDCLEKAIKIYIKKNPANSIQLKLVNKEPKQYFSDTEDFKIKYTNVKSIEELESLNNQFIKIPFNLFDSRLYDFLIFKLPKGKGGFNVKLHHIISDAWNMGLLVNQIMDIYSSLLNNEDIDLTPFPSYEGYIQSEINYLNSSRYEKDALFWHSLFSTTPEISYISSNKNINSDTKARRKIFNLDKNLYNKISDFCYSQKVSIYTFFMSIYSLYISKLNNTNCSIIGTPILNRSNFKEKHTSGMFISNVPFKIDIDKDLSFLKFLNATASTQLSIFKHQKYPYDKLLEDIKEKYDISDNLYDMVLSYQNARDGQNTSKTNFESKWAFNGHSVNTLEVHFYDLDNTGIVSLFYDYQINKLSEKDIENMHKRILSIINTILLNPEITLENIEIVTEEEKEFLLNNYTSYDLSKHQSLISMFEKQSKNNPKKIACIFENNTMTYEELNIKSNQLANMLIENKLGKNNIISIILPRGFDLLISILGILKSGNGYLLIDPTLPKDRIKYMLENSKTKLIITNSNLKPNFKNTLLIDTFVLSYNNLKEKMDFSKYKSINPPIQNDNDDVFGIIYTSGSTGTPKGIMLKRIGIINLVLSHVKILNTNICDNFLSASSINFDMFIVENFTALLCRKNCNTCK